MSGFFFIRFFDFSNNIELSIIVIYFDTFNGDLLPTIGALWLAIFVNEFAFCD